MEISGDDVLHIAELARLRLSEKEKETFREQLSGILQYVAKLNDLDTEGIEPTSHVLKLENVFREDSTRPSLDPEQALANAPERAGHFYKVPKIIE